MTYQTAGDYSVSLIVTNAAGSNTISFDNFIAVEYSPIVGFTYVINLNTITFTNTSQFASNYLWNFGDGSTDTSQNPIHVYSTSGTYTVTLTATSNDCGTMVFSHQIVVFVVNTNDPNWAETFRLSPNPTTGIVQIQAQNPISGRLEMVLFDANGRQVRDFTMETPDFTLDVTDLPTGFYALRISDREKLGTVRLAVIR